MDLSPVWISLKTSVVSIIITFFLGIWAARGVVSVRSTKAGELGAMSVDEFIDKLVEEVKSKAV